VDDVRGRVVEMYVCLYPGIKASSVIEAKVNEAIETDIGKIGRPKNIWIVPDLPRTRSGDIVRGVVAAVSNFADVGDITMLVNPEVVESIRHHVQGRKISKDRIFKQPGH
jgi:acetyl-CoA synthetase